MRHTYMYFTWGLKRSGAARGRAKHDESFLHHFCFISCSPLECSGLFVLLLAHYIPDSCLCAEISCGPPLTLPHTNLLWDRTSRPGSVVLYECMEGFYQESGNGISTCLTSGEWGKVSVKCKGTNNITEISLEKVGKTSCDCPPPAFTSLSLCCLLFTTVL